MTRAVGPGAHQLRSFELRLLGAGTERAAAGWCRPTGAFGGAPPGAGRGTRHSLGGLPLRTVRPSLVDPT